MTFMPGFKREFSTALRNAPPRAKAMAIWRLQAITDLRPKQLAPPGDWFFWNIRAGRGWGKTFVGAHWMAERCIFNPGTRGVLVAPTNDDCRAVGFEGDSGLLKIIPPVLVRKYNRQLLELELWNGSLIVGKSAEKPDRLRGPQFHWAWCDEIAAWGGGKERRKIDGAPAKSRMQETFDNMLFGLRLGNDPRCVITSTPRPLQFLRDLEDNPRTITTVGHTLDNKRNLAGTSLALLLDTYEGTRLGAQELSAEILSDVEGALWSDELLDRLRVEEDELPEMVRIVVAIDPAVTANALSDETGIIVAGIGDDGHQYTLADLSGKHTPRKWAQIALAAYERFNADVMIGEANNGGDLIEANLQAEADGQFFHYKKINARKGKYLRAEPVAALYEKERVHHVGCFPELEHQMTHWTGYTADHSPDRLDAAVYAHIELALGASRHAFLY